MLESQPQIDTPPGAGYCLDVTIKDNGAARLLFCLKPCRSPRIRCNRFDPLTFALPRLCSPPLMPPTDAGVNANATKPLTPSGCTSSESYWSTQSRDDPSPEAFDEWLLNYPTTHAEPESSGAVSAMARAVLEEWRLAHSLEDFRVWLERGAPSDDAKDENPRDRTGGVRKDEPIRPVINRSSMPPRWCLPVGKASRMGDQSFAPL